MNIFISSISLTLRFNFAEQLQIFKGDAQMPKWLSPGAQNMIRRILDPNPLSRITIADIKADEWFKKDYAPANPNDDEEDIHIDDEAFRIRELV